MQVEINRKKHQKIKNIRHKYQLDRRISNFIIKIRVYTLFFFSNFFIICLESKEYVFF
jgi:hypothetical protein